MDEESSEETGGSGDGGSSSSGGCCFWVILIVIWVGYQIFFSKPSDEPKTYSSFGGNSSYSESEYYTEPETPENPYDEGSGHYAGYEWAERTGGDCSGNSNSFNEGCEEYYSQQGEYDESMDEYANDGY
jgi:hypothetical protein